MFRKDAELLTEAYLNKISENLGPNMEDGPSENLSTVKPALIKKKILTPPERPCNKDMEEEQEDCEECGGECGAQKEDTDSDSYMAKQLLYRIFKLATMIYPLIKGENHVEAWVLDKISKAHDNLSSVFGYKDFEQFKNAMMSMGGIGAEPITGGLREEAEESEIDLFNAINSGGENLLKNLEKLLKRESKETKEKIFLEVIKQLES